MGLLDGLAGQFAGQLLGGSSGAASGLLDLAQTLLGESGGLPGLLQKFQQAGFSEQVNSWLGEGKNLPISADQIITALGSGTLAKLASQFGMANDQASSGLAQILPGLVDSLTPGGKITDSPLSADKLGSLLGNFLK